MAAPWERYQQQEQPQDGPWARYSKKPKTAEELTGTSIDPTVGMSGADLFAAGAGKSLRDTGLGLVQSAGEGGIPGRMVRSAFGFFGAEPPRNPVEKWATDRIEANAAADSALTDTDAGMAGNIAGTVAQFVGPAMVANMASKTPQFAGQASRLGALVRGLMPQSVAGSATQGAIVGSVAPVRENGSRLANMVIGAGAGATGAALPRLFGAAVRAGNRLIEPFTERGMERVAGRTVQRFASNPANLAQTLDDPILGRAPTLAEATLDPGIAQLQRAAQSRSPDVANAIFDARRVANEGRIAALERFAGTPEARAAAVAGVDAAEEAAYGAIRGVDGVNVRPVIQQIDDILAGPQGKRPAVQSALNEARKVLFMDAEQAVPENSVDRLLGARLAIQDALSGKGDNKAGQLAQAQLIQVRNALDDAIRKVAPGIDQALDARRVGMRPVNEMDTMRELVDTGTIPVADRQGITRALQPARFLRPTEDLDALARRGTGFRRAQADNVLSPEAQDAIEGVRVGLARQQFAENAARGPGSPTAQYLAGQNVLDALGLQPNSRVGALLNSAAAVMDKPYSFAGVPQRLEATLAKVLTNPAEAQRVLAALPAPDRQLLEQAVGRYLGAPVGVASGRSSE